MLRRVLLVALSATAIVAAVWFLHREKKEPPTDPVYPDPRLTFETPYLNVRPEVQYVGTKTCAECHDDKASSYARHPMGRSFAPLSLVADRDRYGPAVHDPFEQFGNQFRIERRRQHVIHAVRRPAAGGSTVFELAHEAAFVMGSGSHGRTY